MRPILFILAPTADDAASLQHALGERGFERLDAAVDSTAAGPGAAEIPPFEALNRDLLRLFDLGPDFPGSADFSTLPSVLEDALTASLRERLRALPSGAPLVQCSHELTATLAFWLQAFPSSGALLVLHEPDARIDPFLRAVTHAPAAVLQIDKNSQEAGDRVGALIRWFRELDQVSRPIPSGERRPWQLRAHPEPAMTPPLEWHGVQAPGLLERLQGVRGASGRVASPADPPQRAFRWRTALATGGPSATLATGMELEACLRRDMDEKEEQLRLLNGEIRRVKEQAWQGGKELRRWVRGAEAFIERIEAEREWRLRLQAMPVFRVLAKAVGMRRLLRAPERVQAASPAASEGGRRGTSRWFLGDPRRRAALESLRAASGLSSRRGALTAEDLRFAPWPEGVAAWSALNASLRSRPRISVLLPVHAIEPEVLRSTINSVLDQVYTNWELCIAIDREVSEDARKIVQSAVELGEGKVRVAVIEGTPGIARSTNAAGRLASGEFVTFLDHDDRLALDALLRIAAVADKHPDADFMYSDEDKIEGNGSRKDPFYKPAWSPELLLSFNYITHLAVIRRTLFEEIGGVREGYEGSQDFDLALRATERARRIERVPHILYHWRKYPGSTAHDRAAKGGLWRESSRRALRDAVERRGWDARVADGFAFDTYRIRFAVDPEARVTIIIPTCDNHVGLDRCVRSILKYTQHPAFDILIVGNNPTRPEMTKLLEELAGRPRVRVLRHDIPFNFSKLNNFAVTQCDSPYVLLLNDDTEALHPEWMTAMLEHAQRPEIGAVGAQLIFASRLVQHAGVYIHPGFLPDHAFKNLDENDPGYYNFNRVVRNCSAVTAACLLIRRDLYVEVGGLDEIFGVTFNDVDFCFRLIRAGYRNVYTPFARLLHFESLSRGVDRAGEKQERLQVELQALRERWAGDFDPDPCYNPNLERFQNPTALKLP